MPCYFLRMETGVSVGSGSLVGGQSGSLVGGQSGSLVGGQWCIVS